MTLTRKMLSTMGIEQDKIDQIIESHADTVNGLKEKASELQKQAERIPSLEKKIEELKAAQPTEDWEAKYNELKSEYEDFRQKVDDERATQEKSRLYRAMLREAGVDEKRFDSIMKLTDLSEIKVEDGKIEDAESVKKSIADEWGDFIVQKSVHGAPVDDPPANAGSKMSKDEIMSIKDTSARQKAIADNIELFQS